MIPNKVKQDKDSLDIDDLRKLKALILTEVINNYTFCITIPFLEEFNLTNDDVTIASLDGTVIEKYRRAGKNPEILLFDDFYMIRIIEFYIKTLQIKTNDGMNIDTYNKYKYDVLRLDSMFTKQEELFHYNDIVLHYLETESKNDEMRIQKFDINIANKARNYINMNFREENDVDPSVALLFKAKAMPSAVMLSPYISRYILILGLFLSRITSLMLNSRYVDVIVSSFYIYSNLQNANQNTFLLFQDALFQNLSLPENRNNSSWHLDSFSYDILR